MSISKTKLLEISVKKNLSSEFLGNYKTAFKGSGLTFSDLREYVVGDSVKSIDWKTSAKHSDLYVKNYEEDRELQVLFLIDLTSSMNFASDKKTKIDLLVEIFFTLSFSAINNNDKIGALVYNGSTTEFIDFGSGEENVFLILNKIKNLINSQKFVREPNSEALKKLDSFKIRNSLVFVLSDKLELDNKVAKLSGLENEIIFINTFDYFENNLSEDSFVQSIGFGSKFINIFTGNEVKREKYKKLRKDKIKDYGLYLRKNGIDHISLDTKGDVFRELLLFFNKRSLTIS